MRSVSEFSLFLAAFPQPGVLALPVDLMSPVSRNQLPAESAKKISPRNWFFGVWSRPLLVPSVCASATPLIVRPCAGCSRVKATALILSLMAQRLARDHRFQGVSAA